jgi:site-specific recombinase XerD
MSKLNPVQQEEPSPFDHQLQHFLNSLTQERGFAEATIINRKRSLKPFLAWLIAQGGPLSAVSPVDHHQVFHQRRGRQVETQQRFVSCAVFALVFSLCQQSKLVRGGHC